MNRLQPSADAAGHGEIATPIPAGTDLTAAVAPYAAPDLSGTGMSYRTQPVTHHGEESGPVAPGRRVVEIRAVYGPRNAPPPSSGNGSRRSCWCAPTAAWTAPEHWHQPRQKQRQKHSGRAPSPPGAGPAHRPNLVPGRLAERLPPPPLELFVDHLPIAEPAASPGGGRRYPMESWSPVTPRQPGQDRATWSSNWHWVRMDRGPARKVWLPRATAIDAVMKCMSWTGLLYIPEMQVLDLATDQVVWRDRWPREEDPSPGPRVLPAWVDTAEQRVRAVIRAETAKQHAEELIHARRWHRENGAIPDNVLRRLPELAAEVAAGTAAAAGVLEPVQEALW